MSVDERIRGAIAFLENFKNTWNDDILEQLRTARQHGRAAWQKVQTKTMYTVIMEKQALLFDTEEAARSIFTLLGLVEGEDYEIEREKLYHLYFQEVAKSGYGEAWQSYEMYETPRPAFMKNQQYLEMSWPQPFYPDPEFVVPDDFSPKGEDGFPEDGYPVIYAPSSVQPQSSQNWDIYNERFVKEGRPVFSWAYPTWYWFKSLRKENYDRFWYYTMSANGRRADGSVVPVTPVLELSFQGYPPDDIAGHITDSFLPKRWKEARLSYDERSAGRPFWQKSARAYDFYINGLDTAYIYQNMPAPRGRFHQSYYYPIPEGGYFKPEYLPFNPNAILHLRNYTPDYNWAGLYIQPFIKEYLGRSELPLFRAPGKKTWGRKKKPRIPTPMGQRPVALVRFLRSVVLWW